MEKPKRPVELTISIGGDSDQEIIHALEQILFEFESKGVRGHITNGGVSSCWMIEIERTPEMTNERYFRELNEFVAKTKRARIVPL